MTQLRQKLFSTVAGQLGRPHGLLGPLVARALNRGNGRAITAAVDAANVPRGGVVHGIELADDMLTRARSRFSRDIDRLLHH
jgi:arsenite methyltransferase